MRSNSRSQDRLLLVGRVTMISLLCLEWLCQRHYTRLEKGYLEMMVKTQFDSNWLVSSFYCIRSIVSMKQNGGSASLRGKWGPRRGECGEEWWSGPLWSPAVPPHGCRPGVQHILLPFLSSYITSITHVTVNKNGTLTVACPPLDTFREQKSFL